MFQNTERFELIIEVNVLRDNGLTEEEILGYFDFFCDPSIFIAAEVV
jgi:hypothetical protein